MKLTSSLKRRWGLLGLALLLIGLFVFVMMRAGPLAPVKVTLAQVKEGSLTPELFGVGTVEARRSWMIGPTVAGRVLSVKADVGDAVKPGQVLAEMDPVDLDQRLVSSEAAIARARSAHVAALAQQADALAKRELAVSNWRRNQDLAQQNFISSGALESVVQSKASADAALDAARANVDAAAQDLSRTQADRAALLQQRTHVRLTAPADGVVSAREAEAGSTVVAGQAVLRVVDPATLWVKLRVDQGRSGGLAPQLKVRMVLRSQPQVVVLGRVARMELISDSVTEERIVQLSFDQLPTGLSVGEMVEATIELPTVSGALIVPAASVQRQGGANGVWRIVAGKPEFVPVQLGARSLGGQVQIRNGLKAGDEVVVYSQKPLDTSSRVQVVDAIVAPNRSSGTAP